MKQFSLFLLLSITTLVYGQNCNNCSKTYNNFVGDIHVKNNESVCITGTFTGEIDFTGGELNICGNAVIKKLNFKQPPHLFQINPGAIVKIELVDNNKEGTINNLCDSLVIVSGNFNQAFTLVNKGKVYIQSGNFNKPLIIENSGSMVINTSLGLPSQSKLINFKKFTINGNLTLNTGVVFENNCLFIINGDLTNNGCNMTLNEALLKVNNALFNKGKLELKNASKFTANNLTMNDVADGVGARSTIECAQKPILNPSPSITGQISLCIKAANSDPFTGKIVAPASLDCSNEIGTSSCSLEDSVKPFVYFKMVPQTSSDWQNNATWEVWRNNQWIAPPSGTYPQKGSTVYIPSGKTMTLTVFVEIKALYLGDNVGSGSSLIINSTGMYITDSLKQNAQSWIDIGNGAFSITGRVVGDLRLKGSRNALLSLNVSSPVNNLVMDQSDKGYSNALSYFAYQIPNGTINLLDTLLIITKLDPFGGILNTTGKLVLVSTKLKTATVGPGTGNYINGQVKVQRYIPEVARRFRFVSTTVSNTTLKDWQEEIFLTGNNAAGNATGQQIGTLNSAGFDASQNFAPSIYFYDETKPGNQNTGWIPVTNETNTLASIPLPVGRGYRMFIRGDRSDTNRLNDQNPVQNEVTLDLKGNLITGDVNIPITYTSNSGVSNDGWNLVGNPYASGYDWQKFYNEGNLGNKFEPSIWVYDSRQNAYISYNAASQAGTFSKGIIPSGQSFWVKTKGANPTLTLKEKYKVASPENNQLRSISNPNPSFDEVSMTIVQDSINSDEMIVKYINGALVGLDTFDIIKFWSDQVGIAPYSASENVYFELSCRPINYEKADFVPIYFFVKKSGNYTLKLKMSAGKIYQGPKAYLLDAFTNSYIDIQSTPEYSFSVDMNNPATDVDRFYLVYFPSTPTPSMVNYFFAEREDSAKVLLSWGSLSEPLPTFYSIERGYNSQNFEPIGDATGTGGLFIPSDYEFYDSTAIPRTDLYYRISSQDSVNTQPTYSAIMWLPYLTSSLAKFANLTDQLSIYPVPTTGQITIAFKDKAFHGELKVTLVDLTGKEVLTTSLNEPNPGSGDLTLDLGATKDGLYFLTVQDLRGRLARFKVLKTN